jgi:hypothetical protein
MSIKLSASILAIGGDLVQILTFFNELQDCSAIFCVLILLQLFLCLYHIIGMIAFQIFMVNPKGVRIALKYDSEPWVFLMGTCLFMALQIHKYPTDIFVFLPNFLLVVLLSLPSF